MFWQVVQSGSTLHLAGTRLLPTMCGIPPYLVLDPSEVEYEAELEARLCHLCEELSERAFLSAMAD